MEGVLFKREIFVTNTLLFRRMRYIYGLLIRYTTVHKTDNIILTKNSRY
jgi:hypothetical protein